MRKIVASVGLVALGASGVQAAELGSPGQPAKPWNVSVTLRGFYDDNINDSPNPTGSFGFEVSPSLLLSWVLERTTINLGYVYSLRWYDVRPAGNTSNYDQDQTFNASVTHSFSERFQANVSDSFVIGQEPDQLRTGYTFDTFQRVSGSNIRNYGSINFDAQFTPIIGSQIGYANTYYDYEDTTPTISPTGVFVPIQASTGGALNRFENLIHIDGTWKIEPQTTGRLGYMYQQVDYTANQIIAGESVFGVPIPSTLIYSDNRNSRSHFVYVGADHSFLPELTANLKGGAQYIDFYNDPSTSSQISPYVQLSVSYAYATESHVDAGFNYGRNSTDQTGFDPTAPSGQSRFVTDVESSVLYASLTQRIMPKFYGSLLAQYQGSTYNGGLYNNEKDNYYLVGLNFEYRFNHHLSGNVGYNYDTLDSNIPGRSYDKNRVYIGVTAFY